MKPLEEFDIQPCSEPTEHEVSGFFVLIHKPCGRPLGEWGEEDPLDLKSATQLAMDHRCEGQ